MRLFARNFARLLVFSLAVIAASLGPAALAQDTATPKPVIKPLGLQVLDFALMTLPSQKSPPPTDFELPTHKPVTSVALGAVSPSATQSDIPTGELRTLITVPVKIRSTRFITEKIEGPLRSASQNTGAEKPNQTTTRIEPRKKRVTKLVSVNLPLPPAKPQYLRASAKPQGLSERQQATAQAANHTESKTEIRPGIRPETQPEIRAKIVSASPDEELFASVQPELTGAKSLDPSAAKGLRPKPQSIANLGRVNAGSSTRSAAMARLGPQVNGQKPTNLLKPIPQSVSNTGSITAVTSNGQCLAELASLGVSFTRLASFKNEKGCGMSDGVEISSIRGIKISPAAKLNCPFAKRLAAWVAGDLNRTVLDTTGAPLAKVTHYSAYRCSFRSKGRISEHGTGNAFDLAGIQNAIGTKLDVLGDWGNHMDWTRLEPMERGRKGDTRPTVQQESRNDSFGVAKRQVWSAIAKSACGAFQLVLTPHSNKNHANHLHIDMGRWKQCEL